MQTTTLEKNPTMSKLATLKVLISDKLSADGIAVLEKAGLSVDLKPGLPEAELEKIIGGYDAMLVRSETQVTKKLIEAAKKMKIIGRAGVGVDNIDVEAATKAGIIVVNSPEGNTIAASEHTIALIFALARNIPQAYVTMKNGGWDRSKFTGNELYQKVLGIVGLGKIGQRVAAIAKTVGMKIVAYDPFASEQLAKDLGVELGTLDKVYAEADFITLHVPKTKETAGMINQKTFAKMKKGVRIINCARGGIINEPDLIEAVKSGQVGGAAIDVFETEPANGHPFTGVDKIITTPHLGASTAEAQVNVAIDVAQQVVNVLTGGEASAPVNIPSMKPDWVAGVKDYLVLAEKLGTLSGQWVEGAIEKISIEYLGEIAKKQVAPLTVSVLKGLLTASGRFEQVNFVNAPIIAKDLKITISETKIEKATDYTNAIHVMIKTAQSKYSFSGSRFENIGERVTEIDGFKVNIEPVGNILLAPNEDRPGVIGQIGTALGTEKINIASMIVARQSVGGNALMVINIDDLATEAQLKNLSSLKGMRGKIKQISF